MSGRFHVGIGVLCGVTGGPATYGRRLISALAALGEPELAITALTDRPDLFADTCDVVHLPMRGGVDRLRWQHVALPRALRRLGCDVYHDTKNALPLSLPVPSIVTVHDLAYHTVPETFGWASRVFLKRATRDAVRRAVFVVVPSHATARDVVAIHPSARDKVRVVWHGIDPMPLATPAEIAAVRARHGLPERYVLHVGTVQKRKNVDLLVRAVRRLREREPDIRCVVVGRRGWLSETTIVEIERDDTARWLGEVSASELPALYGGATVFCSPSAYEGFGFTVADALAAGVPTVISGVSSLPEVCGDAAVRLPEISEAAIARALADLVSDADRRATLAEAGRRRAAEFTWRRAAVETLAVYRAAGG